MDEKEFFTKMDTMHEELIEGLATIMLKLKGIEDAVKIKLAVKTSLADFSKEPKTSNTYTKFTVEHEGETYEYSKNKKCKYCDTHYTAWKKPYVKGDKPISVDYEGNIMEGCPKYT